ncbi:unnamed protein product [Phytophthora lilii]|uniref:Unnamed protein product n=1 Tax=Phytophthora lilii TaxID=2077276 RepID=A0A9W6X4T0_9STRA|nr:unnamed protein product [Phytophthora lilii]
MVKQTLSASGGGTSYGTASNIHSAESVPLIKSTHSTPPRRLGQWYTNMFMINFLEFATESSRGIVLPTLFLYTSSLGGDLAFMGFINALFSLGRLFSSTAFGWMCDRYSFRFVYLISTFICLVGNIIYLVADEHMAGSLTALAMSRFIVGFGGGNRSVCRADVASITTINQRLPYLTILVGVVFLGYALTPGLGSLVADTDLLFCGVHFNKFTSPGMILVLLNVLTIFGILTVYDDTVTVHDGPEEEETDGPVILPPQRPRRELGAPGLRDGPGGQCAAGDGAGRPVVRAAVTGRVLGVECGLPDLDHGGAGGVLEAAGWATAGHAHGSAGLDRVYLSQCVAAAAGGGADAGVRFLGQHRAVREQHRAAVVVHWSGAPHEDGDAGGRGECVPSVVSSERPSISVGFGQGGLP